jgi:hypothetical protein
MSDKLVKRQISEEEQVKIDGGLQRWIPDLIPSYKTPVYNLLSDPIKISILLSLFLGLCVVLFNQYVNIKLSKFYTLALYGGVLLIVIMTYVGRVRTNGDIVGLIPYLPENPTYYDYKKNLPLVDIINRGGGGIMPIMSMPSNNTDNTQKKKKSVSFGKKRK